MPSPLPDNAIKEKIRHYILKNYLKGETPENLRDDTRLQSSGVLDSLAVLGLITFVEKEYSIELSASETGVVGFDCINDIAALIERKRA